jgi:hypothetical protein
MAVMLADVPAPLVSENEAALMFALPVSAAETVKLPASTLAVKVVAVATPSAAVVTVTVGLLPEKVAVAPEGDADAVKVTFTPATGLPPESLTSACSKVAYDVETWVLCGEPAAATIVEGPPCVFVREKFAGADTPDTEAVTVKEPVLLLAIGAATVATPFGPEMAVAVVDAPANVALAADVGAVNVTIALGTGLPAASFTRACKAVENAVAIAVLCGVPEVATTSAGPPTLVREKLVFVAKPAAVAVTV